MQSSHPVRVIFDLDGTLVDSVGSIGAAAARMLAEMGRPPLPQGDFQRFVGRGIRVLVRDVLIETGGLPDDGGEAAFRRYGEIYSADPVTGVTEYSGARDALLELAEQGCMLGVCTQKPEAPARQILSTLRFMPPVSVVVGGDTLPGVLKPNPKMLFHAADKLGTGPLIYVGDSGVDAQTAANAEVPFILTAWGYRTEAPAELTHSAVLGHFADLPDTVTRLIRKNAEFA